MLIYNNTIPAIFARRLNRFTAEVLIDNKPEFVHVKNTGRLKELLVPGAQVTLQRMDNPGRKTRYDLISVYKPGLEWVNIDSLAPNELVRQHLMSQDYDVVKPEYTYGASRFDFYMERRGEKYLMEVKGCTLAVDAQRGAGQPGGTADAQRGAGWPGDTAEPQCDTGLIGLFPDAPTERGVKHLDELAAAAREGYHCSLAFVIQMNGIHTVLPNNNTQPEFGRALDRAKEAGVQVKFYRCRVEADRIELERGDGSSFHLSEE